MSTSAEAERRYRPADTRERILDAARALFRNTGYLNTSTQDIAKAAGVAEGSIFYHYGSKKNLLAALGAEYAKEKIEAMRGGANDLAALTPGVMISRSFDYCETHGFSDTLLGLPKDSPEIMPFLSANRDVIVGFIEQCVCASMPEERRDEAETELMASFAYAVVADALGRVFGGSEYDKKDEIKAECIRFVEAAMGRPTNVAPLRTEKET